MASESGVAIENWGRDHWSTLLYLDHVVQDSKGYPDREKMRCDPAIHPGLATRHHTLFNSLGNAKYPTRLRDGLSQQDHDDWSCFEDMEAAGMAEWRGSGTNPVVHITPPGYKLVAEVRKYRAEHSSTTGFEPSFDVVVEGRMLARDKELKIAAR